VANEPDEDDFAAAMMRMARPTLEKDEADAEYAAAEALKLGAAKPVVWVSGDDDMPIPMDYEGED
jgi:pimeloyl-ACP methyl ester carboxylesterase